MNLFLFTWIKKGGCAGRDSGGAPARAHHHADGRVPVAGGGRAPPGAPAAAAAAAAAAATAAASPPPPPPPQPPGTAPGTCDAMNGASSVGSYQKLIWHKINRSSDQAWHGSGWQYHRNSASPLLPFHSIPMNCIVSLRGHAHQVQLDDEADRRMVEHHIQQQQQQQREDVEYYSDHHAYIQVQKIALKNP